MPPRSSRSKSPAAKKKGAAFDPMDYQDEAVALVLCLGLAHFAGPPSSLTESLTGLTGALDKNLPSVVGGQTAMLTLHTLNCCQNRGKKFWLTDIMECVGSVYAAGIALALLKDGGSLGDALMGGDESKYVFTAICWYLQNHSIGGVVPNLWKMVTDSPIGAGLQKAMSLATILYVNGIIWQAASGDGYITPLVKAALVASASSAIPAKPISSPTTTSALVIGVLAVTKGLTALPEPIPSAIGQNIGEATKAVTGIVPLGSDTEAIYHNLIIISFFLGGMLASVGVPGEILNPGPAVGGLVNKVLNIKA